MRIDDLERHKQPLPSNRERLGGHLIVAVSIDRDLLEAALAEIRPALQHDGGDVSVRSVDDEGVVTVELLGACGTCPLQIVTLAAGIELFVQRRVPGVSGVIAHSATLPPVDPIRGLDVSPA